MLIKVKENNRAARIVSFMGVGYFISFKNAMVISWIRLNSEKNGKLFN